jgi:outer membrane protein TolC
MSLNVPRDSPWWDRPVRPSDPLPLTEVSLNMEREVAEAEEHRPDLKQARTVLRSKEIELSARENLRRWGLNFEGQYGLGGVSGIFQDRNYSGAFDNLQNDNQEDWTLSLLLSVPIGNRLAIANYVDAEHALNQAQFELQRRQQDARFEVRKAVRTVLTNQKRVHATKVNVRLQTEKLEAEQKKFENGMSTSFQVLEFQNDLTAARTRENLAIVDYNKSQVELERAKGTLLQARRMLIPSQEMGQGEAAEPDYTAALRSLWRREADRVATAVAPVAADVPETINLPTSFVFTGSRIVGRGGNPGLEINAFDTR